MGDSVTISGKHVFCRRCGTQNLIATNDEGSELRACPHCGRAMVDVPGLLVDVQLSWADSVACKRCRHANPAPYCYFCGLERIVPTTPAGIGRPPPVLNAERVLEYAILSERVGFSGHTGIFLGNQEVGRVPCLAICELDDAPTGVRLHHCDAEWTTLVCPRFDSVAEAKARAERAYPGVAACWTDANVTREEAARHVDELYEGWRCSFCNRKPEQVEEMIAAGSARICNLCIDSLHADLHEADRA